MRWFVGWLLLVLSMDIRAGEVFLIPENNPKPAYPPELYRAGVTGMVRVTLTVQADGSVRQAIVPADTHPELGASSLAAVKQWQFKPWAVTHDQPAEITVIAPMEFRLDSELPIHANKALAQLRCRELNKLSMRLADSSWVDMPAFNWIRSYLTHSLSPTQLPNERRLELIARLNRKVPVIVRQCQDNPVSRYARFLPEEIRQLL